MRSMSAGGRVPVVCAGQYAPRIMAESRFNGGSTTTPVSTPQPRPGKTPDPMTTPAKGAAVHRRGGEGGGAGRGRRGGADVRTGAGSSPGTDVARSVVVRGGPTMIASTTASVSSALSQSSAGRGTSRRPSSAPLRSLSMIRALLTSAVIANVMSASSSSTKTDRRRRSSTERRSAATPPHRSSGPRSIRSEKPTGRSSAGAGLESARTANATANPRAEANRQAPVLDPTRGMVTWSGWISGTMSRHAS